MSRGRIERWNLVSIAGVVAAIFAVACLSTAPLFVDGGLLNRLTALFIYIMLALTWNALAGYAGLVSIGQQVFFGLGAYVTVRLSAAGVNIFAAFFLAPLLVGALAYPLSIATLRLKQGEFAIGMWVIAELAYLLVKLDPLIQGETGTSLLALNAYSPGLRHTLIYLTALASMTVVVIVLYMLLRSRFGVAIQAIRDNEEAAASVGVRVEAIKRLVFLFSAFGAALAGSLWLGIAITFQPAPFFSVQWTAYMIFMVLVGGIGSFEGALLGAIVFFVVETWFGGTGVWYLIGLGSVALAFALVLPRGIWGQIDQRWGVQLLPIGYRLKAPAAKTTSPSDHR
jgi:branched-chain amino acid transport system permease protein